MAPLPPPQALGSPWKGAWGRVHRRISAQGLKVRLHHPEIQPCCGPLTQPPAERTGKWGRPKTLIRICKISHSPPFWSPNIQFIHLPAQLLQLYPPPKRDNTKVSSIHGIEHKVYNRWKHAVRSPYIKSLGSSASLSAKVKSYLAPTHPVVEKGNRHLWSWEILSSFCGDILSLLPWLDLDGALGDSNIVLLLCDSWPHPEDVVPVPCTSWTH